MTSEELVKAISEGIRSAAFSIAFIYVAIHILIAVVIETPATGTLSLDVLIDKETGCQYLESSRSAIIPRVDGSGRHMGCKEFQK
jgi:hypothetical protein